MTTLRALAGNEVRRQLRRRRRGCSSPSFALARRRRVRRRSLDAFLDASPRGAVGAAVTPGQRQPVADSPVPRPGRNRGAAGAADPHRARVHAPRRAGAACAGGRTLSRVAAPFIGVMTVYAVMLAASLVLVLGAVLLRRTRVGPDRERLSGPAARRRRVHRRGTVHREPRDAASCLRPPRRLRCRSRSWRPRGSRDRPRRARGRCFSASSIGETLDDFARGVIDAGHIVTCLTIVAVALFLTRHTLEPGPARRLTWPITSSRSSAGSARFSWRSSSAASPRRIRDGTRILVVGRDCRRGVRLRVCGRVVARPRGAGACAGRSVAAARGDARGRRGDGRRDRDAGRKLRSALGRDREPRLSALARHARRASPARRARAHPAVRRGRRPAGVSRPARRIRRGIAAGVGRAGGRRGAAGARQAVRRPGVRHVGRRVQGPLRVDPRRARAGLHECARHGCARAGRGRSISRPATPSATSRAPSASATATSSPRCGATTSWSRRSTSREVPDIPADATLTIVAGPRADFFSGEIDALRRYRAKGGAMLFLVDPFEDLKRYITESGLALFMMDPSSVSGTGELRNLTAFVRSEGAELGNDVVVDQSEMGQFIGTDASVPVAASYPAHPITQGLTALSAYPMARSVTPGAGRTARRSRRSSRRAIAPGPKPTSSSLARASCRWTRRTAIGPVRSRSASRSRRRRRRHRAARRRRGSPGWSSSGIPISRRITRRIFPGTRDMFLSIVRWLAQDTGATIPPRLPAERVLTMTPAQQTLMSWFALLLLPGCGGRRRGVSAEAGVRHRRLRRKRISQGGTEQRRTNGTPVTALRAAWIERRPDHKPNSADVRVRLVIGPSGSIHEPGRRPGVTGAMTVLVIAVRAVVVRSSPLLRASL